MTSILLPLRVVQTRISGNSNFLSEFYTRLVPRKDDSAGDLFFKKIILGKDS